ncbi:hypothetical protein F5Y08DRAFT_299776 [Xylaria arbuscula]|nr:hypothetical protein F5Y08DRAFT_299776 [Xylaria arbuscula]
MDSQAGSLWPPVQAWKDCWEQFRETREAVNRLFGIDDGIQAELRQEEAAPCKPRMPSAVEKLPDEIVVIVMEYLDYESLYNLSETTGSFFYYLMPSIFMPT